MKAPPFLLLAALLFWGWQSGFFLAGVIMGVVLESARFTGARWDLDDTDFNRIWSFCVLLVVVLAGYVFTTNDQGGGLSGLLHGNSARNAVNSGALTATRFLRWLPMTTFPFIAAQMFNARQSVPLTAVSLVLRWRRRKGDQAFAGRYVNISYPYFIICLFSAGIHANEGIQTYFWGNAVLIAWALWSLRSRRFGIVIWLCAFAAAVGLGFLGQSGIGQAQRFIENFDAQWMSRFLRQKTDASQSMTAIGKIGALKLSPRIVIRLELQNLGQVPTYLREASYRNYHSQKQTWYAGGPLNAFENVSPESGNESSWILQPAKTNEAVVSIACYLTSWSQELGEPEGLLPLPASSSRLENLPVFPLKMNKTGAVLADGPGLVIFDAHYGPGATFDSPPDARTNWDLIVPTNEIPALDEVISEMKISDADDERAKLLAVEKFFAGKFTYSAWQGTDKLALTNTTPLTRFLLTSRSGHCEYFATATVLLLRELKIPSRYAVGYAVHETSGSGYVVRERDAHAWCLAWNGATKSWMDFDTTPASWVAIEGKRASFMEWFSDFRSWIGFEIAKFRWRQAHLREYIFWALVPVMAVLLYYIIFRHRKKRQAENGKKEMVESNFWPGLDSEFYRLESKLTERGVPRQPNELLSDWLERALAETTLTGLRNPLRKLLRLHYRHRFDPDGLSEPEREALKREAKICLDALIRTNKTPDRGLTGASN